MYEPSALEQYQLELLNIERAQAGAQPLAFDLNLSASAEGHSLWMIATDTFSHAGAGGSTPTDRMVAAGYLLTGSWSTGENIAWASLRGAPGYDDEVALLHANLMNSPGHKANILNDTFRQVGLGFEVGEFQGWQGAFITQNFGKTGSAVFVTGVAFDDLDGDRAYDPGEGLGGLAVTATGAGGTYRGVTYASGGYQIALPDGGYTLTFSGAFGAASQAITVAGRNVKADLIDPVAGARQTPAPAPAPTATAGADLLHGSAGADTIAGAAGNDTIDGGSGGSNYLRGEDGNDQLTGGAGFDDINGNLGDDTASGGEGEDWVVGGKDQDVLHGEGGGDIVYGNLGNDTVDGGAGEDVVRGGQDNDLLQGGDGNDWLSGDRGSDTAAGGAGADVFHSFGEAGLDLITDFSRAQGDRIMLDAGTAYSVSQSGADTVVSLGGGGQVVLAGVSMASLTGDWIFGA